LENYDQKEEVLIYHGIESSWITNHPTVTEMTRGTLGIMVVDKKGILEKIV